MARPHGLCWTVVATPSPRPPPAEVVMIPGVGPAAWPGTGRATVVERPAATAAATRPATALRLTLDPPNSTPPLEPADVKPDACYCANPNRSSRKRVRLGKNST